MECQLVSEFVEVAQTQHLNCCCPFLRSVYHHSVKQLSYIRVKAVKNLSDWMATSSHSTLAKLGNLSYLKL